MIQMNHLVSSSLIEFFDSFPSGMIEAKGRGIHDLFILSLAFGECNAFS